MPFDLLKAVFIDDICRSSSVDHHFDWNTVNHTEVTGVFEPSWIAERVEIFVAAIG